MDFRVLGSLRVSDAGRPVEIGAGKRRLVLALLLARAGRAVPTDVLVEAVWGAQPPASARRNIQLYAHQLRRSLGGDLVVTRADGYAIEVGDRLDAAEFRRLVADGGASLDAGDPGTAEQTLRAALDLWQGPAFGDFLDCAPVADEAQRLELLRLETYERWADARLAAGATAQLAAELAELCRSHPYRESLRAQQMRALYQIGRQAEALAVFRETRALLVEELGVEPGPALRRVHEAILRGEDVGPSQEPNLIVPRELPPDPATFTGREDALGFLDQSLMDDARPVVICGMGGVGKTTIAVRWAHRVSERFPDGQLYLNLRGYAPGAPMRPVEAVGLLLRALGVPPVRVPVELDIATGMYRTLLADRRMLVVLDNARDAEQVRPLLPPAPGCLAIVTSRDRLTGLVARDGARRLVLDVFTPAESVTLVNRLMPDPGPELAGVLARACGNLPLAIRIAAAYLADRPGLPIRQYAGTFRSSLDGLEIDGDPEASVRSAFAHSYRALDAASQRLFRLLGVVPGPDVTAEAAAAVAGTSSDEAQRLLDVLARAHLVDPSRPGRYALHDLLRAYAAEQAHAADELPARSRLLAHYLRGADAAATVAYEGMLRLPLPAADVDGTGPAFDGSSAAMAWFDAERRNLVAAAADAGRRGPQRYAWLLADRMRGYFWFTGYLSDWLELADIALASALREGDVYAVAAAHLNAGDAYAAAYRHEEAIKHYTDSADLTRRLGWTAGESSVLNNLGIAYIVLGRLSDAAALYRRLLGLETSLRRPMFRGLRQCNLGWVYEEMGRLDDARTLFTDALAVLRTAQNPSAPISALTGLARLDGLLGRVPEALDHATEAMRFADVSGEPTDIALAANAHGFALRLQGQPVEAIRLHQRAYDAALTSHFRLRQADSLRQLADAYHATGDLDGAERAADRAITLIRRYGTTMIEGATLNTLAAIHASRSRSDLAERYAQEALARHRDTGQRLGEAGSLTILAALARAAGNQTRADDLTRQAADLYAKSGGPAGPQLPESLIR